MLTDKTIMVELSLDDREDYEILEKVLYLAQEFDKETEHFVRMEMFCSSNNSFISVLCDVIVPMLAAGRKIIAFGTYNTVVQKVYDSMLLKLSNEYPVYHFSGAYTNAQRRENIEKFNAFDSGALLVTTNALNNGYKLEGDNVVIHLDMPNSLSTFNQRNRRGLTGENGEVFNLISKDTMHEKKYEILKKQLKNISQLTQ